MSQQKKAAAPQITLHYFNVRGRAEHIRYLFAVGGVQYNDNRIETGWADLKEKMPFGTLPVLEIDGEKFGEGIALGRYVARLAGLYSDDPKQSLLIDSVVDTMTDIREAVVDVAFCKDEAEKKEKTKKFLEEKLSKKLAALEKLMKIDYFLDKISWADIHFYTVMEIVKGACGDDVWSGCTKLPKLYERVGSHPKMVEYIKKRPQTSF